MLKTFPDIEQRSEQWFEVRRGFVTASVVGKLVSQRAMTAIEYDCPACEAQATKHCRSKVKRNGEEGAPIKTPHAERTVVAIDNRATSPAIVEVADGDDARNLTELLVAERITGWSEETFVSNDMLRGVLCEPIAREAYGKHHAPVTELGFMRRDEVGWTLGLSPDGLVGEDGLVEIKAARAKTHIRTILADEVPAFYMPQCQAALLVSGREWLDFVSFCGGLPLYVKRVLPNEKWFAAIEAACRQFEDTAAAMVTEYNNRVVGLPLTERIPDDLELVI